MRYLRFALTRLGIYAALYRIARWEICTEAPGADAYTRYLSMRSAHAYACGCMDGGHETTVRRRGPGLGVRLWWGEGYRH